MSTPSRHVGRFNHDRQAERYDQDVADEDHPVRDGYAAALAWVANEVSRTDGAILELGTGTGNLTRRLASGRQLTCVDISAAMLEQAKRKLSGRAQQPQFVVQDLLGFFATNTMRYGVVVSTFAVHHLEQDEKQNLFSKIREVLHRPGVAVFADLMFAGGPAREQFLQQCRQFGRQSLAAEIEDEFYWDIDAQSRALGDLGFNVETQCFGPLIWGLVARV